MQHPFTADNTEVEAYFIAGTAGAAEHNTGDDCACVVCGSPLKHVFATNHGLMGGDCLATITGDHSTRAVLRKLRRFEGYKATVTVKRCGDSVTLIVTQVGRQTFRETRNATSPVVAAVIGWAESNPKAALRERVA